MSKSIVIVLVLAIVSTAAFSQEKSKKELRKEREAEQLQALTNFANNQQWVIEAHTVYNKRGQSYPMNPTTNFVGVDGDETTVQLSFNTVVGWNGLGGITLTGKITKYEVKGKPGKPFSIRMRAIGGSLGNVDLVINVSPSGYASASIRGNFGDRITFAGQMVSLQESRVYKGQETF